MQNRQVVASSLKNPVVVVDATAKHWNDCDEEDDSRHRDPQPIAPVDVHEGAKRRKSNRPSSKLDRTFRIKFSAMKNDFHEEKLAYCLTRLISMVTQDKRMIYSRHLDICDKRDTVLSSILSSVTGPVCMLSVAAKLEGRIRNATSNEASMNMVQSFRDPFEHLRVWTKEEVQSITHRVHPHMYRLLSVLKTIDSNKYKANNIPWMLLGMLYLCTGGHTIGTVTVLPRVKELCYILPSDNRIFYYFGSMGINTKCVTEMSNMIAGTLKNQDEAIRVLANV